MSAAPRKPNHWIALLGTFFKLFKSAAAVKVALAGASFAGWSLLLNWRFALMLLGIIMFHEYGHVYAMRRCGIATKGFYLIPFVGGMAIGERARSYWHETYVSIMGPVFGLYMTLAAALGYWLTGVQLLAALASFSALINMFNLLPVYPLDGGHIVKAIALSVHPRRALPLVLLVSAAALALAISAGIYLLAFFVVLGAIDLLSSRKAFQNDEITPMSGRGMAYALLWYVGVIVAFVLLIYAMAATGVPSTEIPRIFLED